MTNDTKGWVYYTHNGKIEQTLVHSDTSKEQAVYDGISLAHYYFPNETIKFIRYEPLVEEGELF